MRIHHLNCVSSCPLGGRLMDGRSDSVFRRGQLCCHCVLLETDRGLVLVDTGFGLHDVHQPRGRLSPFFLLLLSPDFREEMTAVRQIERLGFRATDVRDILLTHLDFDHAGGLDDFPDARVHMMGIEHEYATVGRTWLDRQRYRPQQWSSRPRWHFHRAGGERWFGFEAVRELPGLPPDVLLVPLPGHTFGHAAIAYRTDAANGSASGWHLHAGDAYFHHREMDVDDPYCTPGLRMYQTLMEKHRQLRLHNQQRLRELKRTHGDEVRIVCAHDPVEFEALARRPSGTPAAAGTRSAGDVNRDLSRVG